jgi:DNA mismatch repair ATPase MutL
LQLPTRSNQYKPNEEPSESEEEQSEIEASEEDLSMGEESEENQSEQDESEEEGSEEHHPKEEKSEEQGFARVQLKQDESEEDGSEEDHSQEDESEEDQSQHDEMQGDRSQEDESEENGLAEGQPKEDGSKKELSDGGQSAEEILGNGCENLMLLKMTNFMGHHNEMELLSFVLKKSTCLNQLILFTPERVHPGGPLKDHLSTSNFLETKLLPLEKASPNAQIILSKPDLAATKPLHSGIFVKV